MAYNLEAIRKLLNAAFSNSEIRTLAFDRFHDVYDDFASGMTTSQMIKAIVGNANRNGRIPDLLNYVKEHNPYQYRIYAPQLEVAEPPPQPVPVRQPAYGDKQRVQDLQRHINREADLLNKYRGQRRRENDPRRLENIDYEINRQKETIAEYREEIAEIQSTLPTTVPPVEQAHLHDITQRLSAMSDQIDGLVDGQASLVDGQKDLADGQVRISAELRQQQETILARIDEKHRETATILVNKMNSNQLEVTTLLMDAAARQQVAKWEAQQLTILTEQALTDMRKNQPDASEWKNLLDALANETGWEQKLKLTIPLIPGILEFESEMAMDVVPALKGAWNTLVNRIRPNRDNK